MHISCLKCQHHTLEDSFAKTMYIMRCSSTRTWKAFNIVQPYKLGKGSFSKACRCDSTCMLNWLLLLLHVSCVIFDLHHLCPYKIIQECSMQCMNYVWKMCTEILWSCTVPQYGPHPVPLWCAQNGPVFAAQL